MATLDRTTCHHTPRSRRSSTLLFFILSLGPGLALGSSNPQGVSNFHKVNDNLYRGGQPSGEGLRSLARLGVKTVIDLRGSGDRAEAEEEAVKAAGMRYVSVPMNGLEAPR